MTEPLARAAEAIGDTLNQGTAQDVLENAALAAICAIRVPTDAMIAEGARHIPGSEPFSCARLVWSVMVRAMMRE